MDKKIKTYADSGDLKSLKYIFVDALDVDPTFVRYDDDYSYCKSVPGLLEPHKELTPFRQDKNQWDEEYWTSLKMDLVKNFSDCRMMHMKEVAQVFLAEKIERILKERDAATVALHILPSTSTEPETKAEIETTPVTSTIEEPVMSRAEQERRELEEAKRQLEVENRRIEEVRRAEAERREQQRRNLQIAGQNPSNGGPTKKAIGIAVAVVAVAVVVMTLVLK